MWRKRVGLLLQWSCFWLLLLLMLLGSSSPLFAEPMTLRVCAFAGYTEPFVDDFKMRMKEKYDLDLDFKILHVIKPDDTYNAALKQSVDLLSITHNMFKSEESPFLEKRLLRPIDCAQLANYPFVLPVFMKPEFVGDNGIVYGIPLAVGFYALAYNMDKVKEEPTSWNVLWDERFKNDYSISSDYYECNIFVTALALGVHPENLYDSQKIFDSVSIRLLRDKINELAKNAYSLWIDEANVDEMKNLSLVTTWGLPVMQANQQGQRWKFVYPKEGLTAWIDCWSITNAVEPGSKKYQICMEWIDYSLSPDVQKHAVQKWGNTPVTSNVNDRYSREDVASFKIGDSTYWENISFWGILNKESTRIEQALWRYALAQRHSRDRMQDYVDGVKKTIESSRSDLLGLGTDQSTNQSNKALSAADALERTDISISLPEFLLQRLRVFSIKKRSSMDALIEEALRDYLERHHEIPQAKRDR